MSTGLTVSRSAKQNGARTANNFQGWGERELIAAAKGGNGSAFGILCERHTEMILRVTFRITRNPGNCNR